MKYILGIDVGTSNVKAVLFDEGGQEVRVASRESETINGAGNHVEQDMYVVWENVKACVKSVMASKADGKEEIVGVGVTGKGILCRMRFCGVMAGRSRR